MYYNSRSVQQAAHAGKLCERFRTKACERERESSRATLQQNMASNPLPLVRLYTDHSKKGPRSYLYNTLTASRSTTPYIVLSTQKSYR
jgi:hypothetical protein